MKLHHLSLFNRSADHCHTITAKISAGATLAGTVHWMIADKVTQITLKGYLLTQIVSVSIDQGSVSIISQDFTTLVLEVTAPQGPRTITLNNYCTSLDIPLFSRKLIWTAKVGSIITPWEDATAGILLNENLPNLAAPKIPSENAIGVELGTIAPYGESATFLVAPANTDFELSWRLPSTDHSWGGYVGICGTNNDALNFEATTDANVFGIKTKQTVRGSGLWWLYASDAIESNETGGVNILPADKSWRINYYGDPATNLSNRSDRMILRRVNGIIQYIYKQTLVDKNSWERILHKFSSIYFGQAYFNFPFSITGTRKHIDQIECWHSPQLEQGA